MKIRITYTINQVFWGMVIIINALVITSCNFTNEIDNETTTACFKIIDDVDNRPLDSAYVRLYLKSSSGVSFNYEAYTNALGECCLTYETRLSQSSLYVEKFGYERYWYGSVQSTIRLKPDAYLHLQIQNIPPSEKSDSIKIIYPCAGYGFRTLIYVGENTNVLILLSSRPGTSIISWTAMHRNLSTDSTITISMSKQDTTFVEILY